MSVQIEWLLQPAKHNEGMSKRPISITIIGWLFIAIGLGAHFDTISHLNRYRSSGAPVGEWIYGFLLMELTRVLAIVSGVLMLRRYNFGRWLCIAWMAFHVILSISHTKMELAVHAIFLLLLTLLLFRHRATEYFRGY